MNEKIETLGRRYEPADSEFHIEQMESDEDLQNTEKKLEKEENKKLYVS